MTVHNHGAEEGAGLSCNEIRLSDGSLKGVCQFDEIDFRFADGKVFIDGKIVEPEQRIFRFDEYDMYVYNRED